MILHEIEKQELLAEPLSEDALHLARAIYNTYINNDEDLYMKIKISTIENLLKLQDIENSKAYIRDLLEEINEPIAVKNFKFYGKTSPLIFLTFCSYNFIEDMIEINLNEQYLLAEEEYMIEPYLSK